MPYIQYGGDSLVVLLEPRCSKLEGSLQTFNQWSVLSNSLEFEPLSSVGAFPFILQGGAPYLHISIVISWSARGSFVFVSRRVPLGRSGVERLCLVGFLGQWVVKMLSHLGLSEWLWYSIRARRSFCVLSIRIGATLLPFVASDPRTACPLRGVLTRSGGLALSQSLA